jgi:threonine dehydratase
MRDAAEPALAYRPPLGEVGPRPPRAGVAGMSITVADVEAARQTIAGQVLRTPMLPAPKLSALTDAEVYVKYENLQVTNSFKDRGAFNKLASLSPSARVRGVIAMSAGNHAQAVAYHAARLAIPATIVMPVTTPFVKVEATQAHGAEVVLEGESVAEAQIRAETIARERGLTLVHPYDDPLVIAGQGTIALEMLEDAPDLDALVIPIGGGGLIAGNAIAARARKPAIEIVGAEAALYPSFWNALHGENRPLGGATLAEGIAVKNVGVLALPIVRELVSEIVLVDEAHLEQAVNAYLTLQKTMAEGAGAAGLAAMLVKPEKFRGRKVGLILCGGNIDARILASIMVRELEREDRIVSFRLTIPDQPGVLGQIATRLGQLGANILGVEHRRLFLDVPAKGARLDVTVETRDRAHGEQIFKVLEADGFQPVWIDTATMME